MPYITHRMPDLLAKARELKKFYQDDRKEMDSHRFLAILRPGTVNHDRLKDIEFIEYLADNISVQKENYYKYDDDYTQATYAANTVPFLKKVIAGALLLSLIEITEEYRKEEDVIKRSSLGKNILNIFEVQKLSDITKDERIEILEALQRYIVKVPVAIDTEEHRMRSEWHPGKTQGELREEINHRLAAYTPAPVCN